MAGTLRTIRFWCVWVFLLFSVLAFFSYYFDPFEFFVPHVSGQILSLKDIPFVPEDTVRVSFTRIGDRTGPAFGKEVIATVAEGGATFAVQLPPGKYKIVISVDTSKRKSEDPFLDAFHKGQALKASLLMLHQAATPLTCDVNSDFRQQLTIDLPRALKDAVR